MKFNKWLIILHKLSFCIIDRELFISTTNKVWKLHKIALWKNENISSYEVSSLHFSIFWEIGIFLVKFKYKYNICSSIEDTLHL